MPESVEKYFNIQPKITRDYLKELRNCIFEAAPQAQETINYKIPAYALTINGKRDHQIMIAGFKKHVGLYPHPTVIKHFNRELKDYKQGKGSVQFSLDKPLPKKLIVRMVAYRLKLLSKESSVV